MDCGASLKSRASARLKYCKIACEPRRARRSVKKMLMRCLRVRRVVVAVPDFSPAVKVALGLVKARLA